MRLLKGLVALTVAMGITTSAQADGWKRIYWPNITGITADIDHNVKLPYITVNFANEDNTCGGTGGIDVYQDSPLYNRPVANLSPRGHRRTS